MKDFSELKRLAEAFPTDLDWDSNTEPFFNGPSGESLGGGSTGFYSVYGKPFRLEGEDYDYDGPTYVEACNADFAKFMVAARDGVLELISENEKLKADLRDAKDAKLGLSWAIGEIKAENEKLRKDAERYRWIRDQSELSSYEDSYALPIVHAWEYKPGPELNEQFGSLDDAIDHAMKILVQA